MQANMSYYAMDINFFYIVHVVPHICLSITWQNLGRIFKMLYYVDIGIFHQCNNIRDILPIGFKRLFGTAYGTNHCCDYYIFRIQILGIKKIKN